MNKHREKSKTFMWIKWKSVVLFIIRVPEEENGKETILEGVMTEDFLKLM